MTARVLIDRYLEWLIATFMINLGIRSLSVSSHCFPLVRFEVRITCRGG